MWSCVAEDDDMIVLYTLVGFPDECLSYVMLGKCILASPQFQGPNGMICS